MCPDPYGQHWSPYMAMGNNWIMMVDPDGGKDGWLKNLWIGFKNKINPPAYSVDLNEVACVGDGSLYTPPKPIMVTSVQARELTQVNYGLGGTRLFGRFWDGAGNRYIFGSQSLVYIKTTGELFVIEDIFNKGLKTDLRNAAYANGDLKGFPYDGLGLNPDMSLLAGISSAYAVTGTSIGGGASGSTVSATVRATYNGVNTLQVALGPDAKGVIGSAVWNQREAHISRQHKLILKYGFAPAPQGGLFH